MWLPMGVARCNVGGGGRAGAAGLLTGLVLGEGGIARARPSLGRPPPPGRPPPRAGRSNGAGEDIMGTDGAGDGG